MEASARLSKEAFTSNNDGSDALTVMGVMAVVPVSALASARLAVTAPLVRLSPGACSC